MKVLSEIAEKQMTRGEFLRLVGVVIVSMIGLSNLISNINRHMTGSDTTTARRTEATRGFGSGKFGV